MKNKVLFAVSMFFTVFGGAALIYGLQVSHSGKAASSGVLLLFLAILFGIGSFMEKPEPRHFP